MAELAGRKAWVEKVQVFRGAILSCDREGSVYHYLVENEGRIVFVGNELPEQYADCPVFIDLASRALLPAFGEGHIHFSSWALFNSTFDVRSASSIPGIKMMIRNYAEKERSMKLVIGYGHSPNSIAEKRMITRTELDEAVKERPVFLISSDGHSAVVNTVTIGLMPLNIRSLPGFNLESGQIFHEAFQAAADHITGLVPPLKLISAMAGSIDTLAEYGIGMVHTVEGIGFPRDMEVDLVRFLARSAQIEFRIYFQTMDVAKALRRRLPRIGGCFACALDGSFGSRDAALLEPYSDDPDNKGVLFYSDKRVGEFVKEANRAGLQVQLHCIGDAAVVQAVGAIEAALQDYPRLDHRHTLIHASLVPDKTLEKIAALDIGVTVQPGFVLSPLEPPEYLESIIGERAGQNSPLAKMVEMGITVSGGSDGPVLVPNPIEGIFGACNQRYPGHSIGIDEALRMYTYNVAYTSFDEKERGSLEEGKIADMVILNKNPLEMNPSDLLQLKVEKLYLAGKEYMKGRSIPRVIAGGLVNRKRFL